MMAKKKKNVIEDSNGTAMVDKDGRRIAVWISEDGKHVWMNPELTGAERERYRAFVEGWTCGRVVT